MIREKANKIRNKSLSALQNVEDHLALINSKNKELNALCFIDAKNARLKAKERDSQVLTGRLHGIVFSVKDNIALKDAPVSEGSTQTKIDKADYNDRLIEILESEGAICIGKGNLPEYGKSNFTDNNLHGRSNNPFNQAYTPGGSTGGDAAALAAGFCDFALGGDSGGSLRVPANFCGLFSILPTRGVITNSRYPFITSSVAHNFGSTGPIARTLDDLELLFSILAKYNSDNPYSVPYVADKTEKTWKIAYFSELNSVVCDKEINKTLDTAIEKFKLAGYSCDNICPNEFLESFIPFTILAGQASLIQEDLLSELAKRPRDLSKETQTVKNVRQKIAAALPKLTSEGLLTQLATTEKLRRKILSFFERYDFILCPVAACRVPKHDTAEFEINGSKHLSHEVFHFSRTANVLALAALAFPTEFDSDGLPMGLQLIGPRFSEFKMFTALRTAGFTDSLKI